MPDVWFISDHHLSHAKLLTFEDKHGCLIRPEYDDVVEMNEAILTFHNETIKDTDTVYFLGDVLWDAKVGDPWGTLAKMKGHKRLTPGNHDKVLPLVPFFEDIKLWYRFEADNRKFIASHVPLAYGDTKRMDVNIHGHLHEKYVKHPNGLEDLRYYNVCVEQMGYTPIHFEDIVKLTGH